MTVAVEHPDDLAARIAAALKRRLGVRVEIHDTSPGTKRTDLTSRRVRDER